MHSLHVWLTVSAIHNNAQSDVQCAEYVLMFVCLVSKRGGEDSPEIEMSHENIRMENHFSVKASFIIARKKPRLVCSIWAPFLPSFTSATPMYLTQCQLWLPLLSYLSLYSCQVMFVTKDWRVFSSEEMLLTSEVWWWLSYSIWASSHLPSECWSGEVSTDMSKQGLAPLRWFSEETHFPDQSVS